MRSSDFPEYAEIVITPTKISGWYLELRKNFHSSGVSGTFDSATVIATNSAEFNSIDLLAIRKTEIGVTTVKAS